MSRNPLRLHHLFEKYARNACSPEELQEMWALIQEYSDNDVLEEEMKVWWDRDAQGKDPAAMVDAEKLFKRVLEKEEEFHFNLEQWKQRQKSPWGKWAAAAAIAVLLATGVYLRYQYKKKPVPALATNSKMHDIWAPQNNHAVITLANGQMVYLDSSGNGLLAQQGKVKVVKLGGGKISYNKENSKSTSRTAGMEYNTLTNPRGSKVVNITLSDGSRVWLNAGSSLTYPVAFTGNERKVSMTGEAYFEVIHNSKMPFRVKTSDELIEDVGTQFNVNAYEDEPALKTTLVEGAVKISLLTKKVRGQLNKKAVLLKPGEQASLEILSSGAQHISLKNDENVDDDIAWKDGKFRFSSVDIATIMRQVARWYDVEVVYKGRVNGTISGGVSRNVNISTLLHVLELTGKVSFTVEGKKVIVQPVN